MGAIHFSIDIELVKILRRQLPLSVMVETGTFKGDTAVAVAQLFQKIYTIELSKDLFSATHQRLEAFKNISHINGSSPDVLRTLRSELRQGSVLYWLDAHWCGETTAGVGYECPLMDELGAIGSLNDNSVILIDDARYFLAPPPQPHNVHDWPVLSNVLDYLRALSDRHRLWIINDVIIFVPRRIEPDVVEYGRTRGIDLQRVFQMATNAAMKRSQ